MRKFFLFAVFVMLAVVPGFAAETAEPDEPFDSEVFFFRAREVELPVVMYHLVTQSPKYIGKYGITPAELRRDLEFLRDNGYNTVVMQDLINFVHHGKQLPKNPIMLTFDDGSCGDYLYLLPLLQEFEMKAVSAIIGSEADKYTVKSLENPNARYPVTTWPEIVELHASGLVEIQSHSYNLHTPPLGSGKKKGESAEEYHARLLADLQKLQEACAAHLGRVPNTYVYPLGVIGEGSREVLEELGMFGSISCQEGLNIIRQGDKDCLFRIKRTNRPSGVSIKRILESIK